MTNNNPTSVISFSIDMDSLIKIRDFGQPKSLSRSASIRLLIKYGLIYNIILDERMSDIEKNALGAQTSLLTDTERASIAE